MRTAPLYLILMLAACGGDGSDAPAGMAGATPTPAATATATPTTSPGPAVAAVDQRVVASFDNPWAMVFLPDGRLLVTEKPGQLQLVTQAGVKTVVAGVPRVTYSSQLGLQDVVLARGFATNARIWLSYAEPASGGQQLAVARATLDLAATPRLTDLAVTWRATPATTGGQLGVRLAFAPDGETLYITSGERQQGTPARDLSRTLGKIVRITRDGGAAAGNPFATTAGARADIWSLGHRNPYGLVFASDGRLFASEMGPAGGDEFNLIEPGRNYGWPRVSEADDYDGTPIPRHATDPAYTPPLVSWTPVIAPGGMIQYRGTAFTGWTDDFLLAGLVQQGIVRARVNRHARQQGHAPRSRRADPRGRGGARRAALGAARRQQRRARPPAAALTHTRGVRVRRGW